MGRTQAIQGKPESICAVRIFEQRMVGDATGGEIAG